MRTLASIQVIKDIQPIPGADSIDVATVEGWKVVVKKDEFKVGDKVVYIEIDSIVPDIPEFEFLRPRKFRVRTIKLRGQVSQGLIVPITILPGKYQDKEVGFDVTDILKIEKYEPNELNRLDMTDSMITKLSVIHKNWVKRFVPKFVITYIYKRYPKFARNLFVDKRKDTKLSWPSFITKTDEDRVQILKDDFIEKYRDVEFSGTEKIDGSSATFYIKDDHFGVCSRNYELKDLPANSTYWDMARKYDIEAKLRSIMKEHSSIKFIVLQGEVVGPSIQKNRYYLKEKELHLFNVVITRIDGTKRFYTQKDVVEFGAKYDIPTVPIIFENIKILSKTIDEILELAEDKSVLNRKTEREGIVWRPVTATNCASFKSVSNKYLLKYEDA